MHQPLLKEWLKPGNWAQRAAHAARQAFEQMSQMLHHFSQDT